MRAGEDDVDALRRQRKVVLDEDLDLVDTRLHEVMGQNWEAVVPRLDLCRSWPTSGMEGHLPGDPHPQRPLEGKRRQPRGGVAQQRHRTSPQAARIESCGWRRVLDLSRSDTGRWKPV